MPSKRENWEVPDAQQHSVNILANQTEGAPGRDKDFKTGAVEGADGDWRRSNSCGGSRQ